MGGYYLIWLSLETIPSRFSNIWTASLLILILFLLRGTKLKSIYYNFDWKHYVPNYINKLQECIW